MDTRVQEELELIGRLELDTLRARYKGITGREPGELGRTFMTRRVAYAAQVELTRQDLTPTDRGILMAIANHDPAVNPKCRPTERRKLETSRASFGTLDMTSALECKSPRGQLGGTQKLRTSLRPRGRG